MLLHFQQIINLKRFQFLNGRWVKSHKIVNFPLVGFDPKAYLANREPMDTTNVDHNKGGHNNTPHDPMVDNDVIPQDAPDGNWCRDTISSNILANHYGSSTSSPPVRLGTRSSASSNLDSVNSSLSVPISGLVTAIPADSNNYIHVSILNAYLIGFIFKHSLI